MRHHSKNRKFGREKGQRVALLKSLVNSLIRDEKIKTTLAKAKELRPIAEKLVTQARDNSVSSRRLIISRTGSPETASALISTIAPKYADRKGGYTRITKLGRRIKDGSDMAIIEFV